ncbi:IS30 family transposase [Sanguibacter antarcticus]|nr:IS30 family transposase [Sanguibacter antarcticus]
MLTIADRVEISTGLKAGWSMRRIAAHIDRAPSVVCREIVRNSTKTLGYRLVTADCRAERNRRRPQVGKVAGDEVLRARVLADLKRSRTPRQIAGRLLLEAVGPTVARVSHSPAAGGATASHEAIYRFIYALPKGDLAKHAVMLRSKRIARRPRKPAGERTGPIVGMVPIDDRDATVADRRVPGHWEGDLVVGAFGRSAVATLVERTTRFVVILGLPQGKTSAPLADLLIEHANSLPAMMRKSLTWDQGSQMARHGALTLATTMPVYFAHPRSPWERGTNENTNGLIREYLPKGTVITDHQPYLDAIAEELNDRPRAALGFYTPREKFEELLNATIASTP